jgi:ABC-type transporter Mla subunit MlaD
MSFEDIGNASKDLKGDFDQAGKSVLNFVGALASIAGVLFPNDPALGQLIMGVGSEISSLGSIKGGGGKGSKLEGATVSNVNFNISTNDAQGVATWAQQHGPTIAAEVVRQADRSRNIRRRFWRG